MHIFQLCVPYSPFLKKSCAGGGGGFGLVMAVAVVVVAAACVVVVVVVVVDVHSFPFLGGWCGPVACFLLHQGTGFGAIDWKCMLQKQTKPRYGAKDGRGSTAAE